MNLVHRRASIVLTISERRDSFILTFCLGRFISVRRAGRHVDERDARAAADV